MYIEDRQLKQFISDSGLVPSQELALAERLATEEGCALDKVLVEEGYLSEDDLRRVFSYLLGIPFVSFTEDRLDFNAMVMIPEPISRRYNLIAYQKEADNLLVAALDLKDLAALDFLKQHPDLKILPRLTDSRSIKTGLRQYQRSLRTRFGDVIRQEAAAVVKDGVARDVSASERPANQTAAGPDSRFIDILLQHAIVQNAVGIHIEPMEREVLVRYRITGKLYDAMVLPAAVAGLMTADIKRLAKLDAGREGTFKDGRFKVDLDGQKITFHVSVVPILHGEKIMMRLLKESRSGFTLEGIGFHGEALADVHRAITQTGGLIIVTGPQASGKTTTLYTILDQLNTPTVNVATIEERIEYDLPRVNQTRVRAETGLTYSAGLRALLKQDPDIIMIGELIDAETLAIAIAAALSGRLVLTTLNLDHASQVAPHLLKLGADPLLLAEVLRLVVGQRLIGRLSEGPGSDYLLTTTERRELEKQADLTKVLSALKTAVMVSEATSWHTLPFYRPPRRLAETAESQAKIAVYEVMNISPASKELIVGQVSQAARYEAACAESQLTLTEDGIYKARSGFNHP